MSFKYIRYIWSTSIQNCPGEVSCHQRQAPRTFARSQPRISRPQNAFSPGGEVEMSPLHISGLNKMYSLWRRWNSNHCSNESYPPLKLVSILLLLCWSHLEARHTFVPERETFFLHFHQKLKMQMMKKGSSTLLALDTALWLAASIAADKAALTFHNLLHHKEKMRPKQYKYKKYKSLWQRNLGTILV